MGINHGVRGVCVHRRHTHTKTDPVESAGVRGELVSQNYIRNYANICGECININWDRRDNDNQSRSTHTHARTPKEPTVFSFLDHTTPSTLSLLANTHTHTHRGIKGLLQHRRSGTVQIYRDHSAYKPQQQYSRCAMRGPNI